MAINQLIIAAFSGFLAVAIGAFGAHGLKGHINEALMTVYQTGVQYHFYHTLALLMAVLIGAHFPEVKTYKTAGWFFVAGIALFSGSLYALALTGVKVLGAVTPLGGLCFLAAWLLLAVAAYKSI
ncbi:uncharacterized membrane protein YgdD (TMEM256/DUF423 family) [Sinobacterium caligoides]|uniref:Uncharacterized membrane protein YgdD (TMEM256/DUF423 family) n=1 Tax=Sinobacterium caligoides TaxID=933926 RepID=A0A3N2DGS0_9GAMM|nr:DUF423 domain-containing protein [Sinobacterium caligoides]ROR98941.1 uncharacterized membrane protein YgdD (TMEM256/DUF423 family) [Sinobacterium caligoides]